VKVTQDRLQAAGGPPPKLPAQGAIAAAIASSLDAPEPAADASRKPNADGDADVDMDMDAEEPRARADASPPGPPVTAPVTDSPVAAEAANADLLVAAASKPAPVAGDTPPPTTSQAMNQTGHFLAELNRPARRRRVALMGGSAVLIALVTGTAIWRKSHRSADAQAPADEPASSAPATAAPAHAVVAAPEATPTEPAAAPQARPPVAAAPTAKPQAPGPRYRVTQLAEPEAARPAPTPAPPPPAAVPSREPVARAKAAAPEPRTVTRTPDARPRAPAATAVSNPPRKPTAAPAAHAATASPAAAAAAYKRGNERLLAGDAAGALEAFGEAIAADPHLAAAHRGLGLAHAQLGHRAPAQRSLRTYLRLAPTAPDRDLIQSRLRLLAP
jgi:hypothetical protein